MRRKKKNGRAIIFQKSRAYGSFSNMMKTVWRSSDAAEDALVNLSAFRFGENTLSPSSSVEETDCVREGSCGFGGDSTGLDVS